MVLDPGTLGYLVPKAREQIDAWYDKVVCTNSNTSKPIRLKEAGQSIAIGQLVSTGCGDGCCDVEVRKNSECRIAELRIKFIDEED